jgi:hypothetical protein
VMQAKIHRTRHYEKHRKSEEELARHGRSPKVMPTARAART